MPDFSSPMLRDKQEKELDARILYSTAQMTHWQLRALWWLEHARMEQNPEKHKKALEIAQQHIKLFQECCDTRDSHIRDRDGLNT